MGYLPFQDTRISPGKSMGQIIGMLEDIGFKEIAQFSVDGVKSIHARHNAAVFKFQVNIDGIKAKLKRKSRWNTSPGDIQARAERIAWRILYERVKSIADSVKYEVESLGQTLGGNLITYTKGGEEVRLADYIIKNIAAGKVAQGQLTAPITGE